jgi:hypothetical protein
MLKNLGVLILAIAACCPAIYATGSHHSSTSSYVRGYTRKDGTYVSPHYRQTGSTSAYGSHSSTSRHPYSSGYVAPGFSPHPSVERDSRGRIKRSAAAKDAFKRQQPCQSTGRGSGACPGYVIDHVNPLECGGADDPSNMQWQTIADGKAKDKTERYCK